MKNPRISPKERGLLKGAIRRVFSRSDLRRLAVQKSIIDHIEPTRPRVKKWSRCGTCNSPTPTYQMEVDHIEPVVPIRLSLEEMSWDDLVNNIWCELDKLDPICKTCHKSKTKAEAKLRRAYKKGLIK